LTLANLNSLKIVGELGFPLHTVHRVECRVVDMSFTGMKIDDVRLGFRIISVNSASKKENHYIDIPSSLDGPKPRIGQTIHFWAYETVVASGYPAEAFKKVSEQVCSTIGLHFRASLVILKSLDSKQADPDQLRVEVVG
jgi:hypothetical protein